MPGLEEVFGWLGTSLTLIFFISPIIPFIKVFQGKLDYEDIPIIIICTSYFNSFIWYIYGNLINSQQIKICYIIGFCASLLLIIIYLIYEIKTFTADGILNVLILFSATWIAYIALELNFNNPKIIGKICVCTSLIIFISPIQLIYRAIHEKNYRLIQNISAFSMILSGLCWVIYGLIKRDYYITGSKSIGIIIGTLQVVFKKILKKKYPIINRVREFTTIGIENIGNEGNYKNELSSAKIDVELEEGEEIKVNSIKIVGKKEEVKENV